MPDDDIPKLEQLDRTVEGLSTLETDLNAILKEAVTQDVVSSASKSAIERLLYLSIIGIALSTFAQAGWESVSSLKPKSGYEWTLPVGLSLIIIYYFACVIESAHRDRKRWIAQLRLSSEKVVRLTKDLVEMIQRDLKEFESFVIEMKAKSAREIVDFEEVKRETLMRREPFDQKVALHNAIARTLSRRHANQQQVLYTFIPLTLGVIAIVALISSVVR